MSHIEDQDISTNVAAVETFEQMNIKPDLLRGMYAYGFMKPSAIQQRFIVPACSGRDIIAQAQSGTGKTSAIAVCSLQRVQGDVRETQVLCLFPTRELAQQTCNLCLSLGQQLGVSAHACIGGKSVVEDTRKLDAGVQIVCGTPGRVFDMLKRRHLRTAKISTWVLDEADEMLGKGFKEQIYEIYRYLPDQVQIQLLSATLPGQVLELTQKFMTQPTKILVKRDELTVEEIKQFYVAVEKEEWKFETLCDLYDMMTIAHAVIFANTRKKVEWLAKKMKAANFSVSFMHGDMVQAERDSIMANFKEGKSRVLITTDLWARGIDVEQVSLVVNYDLPISREQYLHRIGRTGRFARRGLAVNLVKQDEMKILKDLETFYSVTIAEMPMNIAELMQ